MQHNFVIPGVGRYITPRHLKVQAIRDTDNRLIITVGILDQ